MTALKSKKSYFILLIIFCSSYAIKAESQSSPDIRGMITNLIRSEVTERSNRLLGSILVKREANPTGEHDKADVKITNETRIYAQSDKAGRTPLKIEALKPDQNLEVRFAPGPALMSYPIQVGAAEIFILSGSPGLSQNSDSEMTEVRRAIDAGNAVWVAAWAKGDAEMLPGTFTSDGKELVAGGKVYKGSKQILALMRESMKKRGGRAVLTVTTTDVWLDGNIAYETGTAVYEFTVNGQPQTLERRYFTIWKRQSKNGVWKIYSNTGVAKE
jgi:uncharacterized protein (TIGR02246 family)